MKKTATIESTADAYLELLAARGVDFLFANAGTDFAPLIEAYARRQANGLACPKPITVPHEIPAVAMAHGHAMVSGKPQAVMVVIEAEHLCMSMRGIRKPGARTVTSAVRGQLRDPATRAEAMSLIVAR